MKSKFLLSPDGLHIVEIITVANNRVGVSLDVNFKDHHIAFDGGKNLLKAIKILFSTWEELCVS